MDNVQEELPTKIFCESWRSSKELTVVTNAIFTWKNLEGAASKDLTCEEEPHSAHTRYTKWLLVVEKYCLQMTFVHYYAAGNFNTKDIS